jgi:pyruvate formate lyase activating enzyme
MAGTEDAQAAGVVFNIQKYSVHDGPGIRTIVFLKGCPLRCRWCSNPESQAFKPELAFNAGRCLGFDQCERCLKACPRGAISRKDGRPAFDRALCDGCARPCVDACPSAGVIAYGQRKTVAEVMRVVEQDGQFYARSRGGLTLSGGEPLAQPDFALAILREAKKRRIGTALETCGHVAWPVLEEAGGLLDAVMFDVKSLDPALHEECTGRPPELAIENLRRLAAARPGLPLHVRTPVIPGFNESEAAVEAICGLVAELPGANYELLRYHRLGTQKYHFLGREAPMGEAQLPEETFARLVGLARERLGGRYVG